MIGLSSNSAGVLLLPKHGTREYVAFDIVGGEEQDPVEVQYLYSTAQDWEEIGGSDEKDILEAATQEYWLARNVSLLREAICGLEKSLEKRVLEHVEEILGSRVSSERVLGRLLVAPLADQYSPVGVAQSALSYGCSAVASILNEMADLQPLLRRLTDLWLSLVETAFSNFSESREVIWATLVEKGKVKVLLRAGSAREFLAAWNLLVFDFSTPNSRSGIQTIGGELSRQLFPKKGQELSVPVGSAEETEPVSPDRPERTTGDREVFERVKKQIDAIAKAISEGRDARARRFLDELIREQTSCSGGETHAVKSLCNIAQRCADMFRMDFEAVCLEKARELDALDGWTLIQYGDHLKRVGNYEEALKVFARAEQLGQSDVAKSSIADVYSQQGEYEKAISAYKAIPDWSAKAAVRTALADNLRRMGYTDESEATYMELIDLAEGGVTEFAQGVARAQAGLAEIAKSQGRLEDASGIYRRIIGREDVGYRDRIFYRLGLCNVLKLMEEFKEAYAVADEIIQEYPFAMQARFVRGSILGLIGQELEGLKDLPESSGGRSWQEWVRHYYRGLLLFKLRRYEDAKKDLVEELPRAIAAGEEKAILRMAAALCFLREGRILEVDGILSEIPDLHDCHAQYLSLVLKLHLATRRKDLVTMNSLRKRIGGIGVKDAKLEKAVAALATGNFTLALTCETDALLKLAA